MAMILDLMEDYIVLVKPPVPDGLGGFEYVYQDGVTFRAFLRKDTSTEAEIAQKQGMNEMFTIVVPKGTPLEHHDIIRRVSDNETFRLTSTARDDAAPLPSSVPIARATCERWAIT